MILLLFHFLKVEIKVDQELKVILVLKDLEEKLEVLLVLKEIKDLQEHKDHKERKVHKERKDLLVLILLLQDHKEVLDL